MLFVMQLGSADVLHQKMAANSPLQIGAACWEVGTIVKVTNKPVKETIISLKNN